MLKLCNVSAIERLCLRDGWWAPGVCGFSMFRVDLCSPYGGLQASFIHNVFL